MDAQPSKGRETFVAFLLVALLGGAIFLFLNFISFGIFSWVLIVALITVVVGFLHYLLWGQSLTQEVAGEREELDVRQSMETDMGED